MSTTNWSAYRLSEDQEQELFNNLLEKKLGVSEALLVSTPSTGEKVTEYIFVYSQPDPEVHNLVSFYVKKENNKDTLLQQHN